MKTKQLICVLAGFALTAWPLRAALVVPAPADGRVATVEVRVSLDRPGWTYPVGAPVQFHIDATADGETLVGTTVRYTVGPVAQPAEQQSAALVAHGINLAPATMHEPGFLRCLATVEWEGHKYRGLATAGFAPDQIRPTQTEPADFTEFWAAQKAALHLIPLAPMMEIMPDLCTSKVDVFHVSFQNVGSNPSAHPSRIYGILCVPKGQGPFPAVLELPGAGIRPYFGDSNMASMGVITLSIGIHGIPVNLPKEVYEALWHGALANYFVEGIDDKETYYYRRVYLGCVRADDFLCSLPQYDKVHLGVSGGSQGGQLTIVTASLDPRVRALNCAFPAYCDVTGNLHGRAGGWPSMMAPGPDGRPSRYATPAAIATTGYYDVVNFARHLQVPGCYSWGYNDETCAPTSMFAAYNCIGAPKQLVLALSRNHESLPEQSQFLAKYLLNQLGVAWPSGDD